MASAAFRRSPLFHRRQIEAEGGALSLVERPHLGKFVLRLDSDAGRDLLVGATGLSLPTEPLSSAMAGELALLWLGPDEWMLVTPAAAADQVSGDARRALAGTHHQLVAVGDYHTTIEVSGTRAREALMKLTTLDLHPRAFVAGSVAGSLFGKAHAVLWQTMDNSETGEATFQLFVRWSMADYLWCLIAEAGREWGMPPEAPLKGEPLTVG